MPASYKKKSNPKCISVGFQAGGALVGSMSGSVGFAQPFSDPQHKPWSVYISAAGGLGLAIGAGAGIEVGVWWDKPGDLAGGFVGIEGSAALVVGATVGFYFNKKLQFLGFVIVPEVGAEAELKYVEGQTFVVANFKFDKHESTR